MLFSKPVFLSAENIMNSTLQSSDMSLQQSDVFYTWH